MKISFKIYLLWTFLFFLLLTNKTFSQECQDIIYQIPPITEKALPLANGDCEMGGHNPHVEAYAKVKRQGNYLVVEYQITITEDRPDYTTFKKKGEKRIYVKELESPDCEFNGLSYEYGEAEGHAGKNPHSPIEFTGSNLISRVIALCDTKGGDCGRLYATFHFAPITVKLRPK